MFALSRSERLVQIAYVLGGVYADTPDPEERVTPEHRQKAQALMGAVEEADCASLTTLFNTVGDAGAGLRAMQGVLLGEWRGVC